MRVNNPREKIGMQFNLTGRIARSRVIGAGHLVRMQEARLPKTSQATKQRGRRKRGRPQSRRGGKSPLEREQLGRHTLPITTAIFPRSRLI